METIIFCKKCGDEAKLSRAYNAATCKNTECDNYNAGYTIGTDGFDRRYYEA
jgi:hypothetical protein